MRRLSILAAIGLSIAVAAPAAWGHSQTLIDMSIPPNEAGVEGGFYVWSAVSITSIWEESNGKTDNGMFERRRACAGDPREEPWGTACSSEAWPGALPPDQGRISGLQLHHVCYGTFPEVCDPTEGCHVDCATVGPGPDCLNCHHSPDVLFSYLPWGYYQQGRWVDGTLEDCEAWGGTFVERDNLLYGPSYDTSNTELTLVSHNNVPAAQCFPPNYGREPLPEESGE